MKIEKCEMESGKIKGVNTNLILQEDGLQSFCLCQIIFTAKSKMFTKRFLNLLFFGVLHEFCG